MAFFDTVWGYIITNGILVIFVQLIANVLINRSLQKQSSDLQKNLAAYQNDLVNQTYLRGKLYDTRFNSIDEIWQSLIQMQSSVYALFPDGVFDAPFDKKEKLRFDEIRLNRAEERFVQFRDLKNRYQLILPEELIAQFDSVLNLCHGQIALFKKYFVSRYNNLSYSAIKDSMKMTPEESQRAYTGFYVEYDLAFEQLRVELKKMISSFDSK